MCSRYLNSLRQPCEENDTRNTDNHGLPRDEWGHKLVKKQEKTIRISFVNVNGIGAEAKHEKSEGIRRYMVNNTVDVMGLAETNVNWGCVENKDTLWDRTKQWVESRRIGVAYNTTQRLRLEHNKEVLPLWQ